MATNSNERVFLQSDGPSIGSLGDHRAVCRLAATPLNRAIVGAMSLDMLREIETHLENACGAGGPIVVRGRKGIFSAGFDMKTFARGQEVSRPMVKAGVRVIERMLALPQPIVMACTGHAYPMGAFLMLCATFASACRATGTLA